MKEKERKHPQSGGPSDFNKCAVKKPQRDNQRKIFYSTFLLRDRKKEEEIKRGENEKRKGGGVGGWEMG